MSSKDVQQDVDTAIAGEGMLVDQMVRCPSLTITAHKTDNMSAEWSGQRVEYFSVTLLVNIDRGPMSARQIMGVRIDNQCQWESKFLRGNGGDARETVLRMDPAKRPSHLGVVSTPFNGTLKGVSREPAHYS